MERERRGSCREVRWGGDSDSILQGSDALFLQGWKLQSSALITIHRAAKLPSASPTKLERLERRWQEWRVDILFCPSLAGHIFCPFASFPVLNSPDSSWLDSSTSIQSRVEHLELDTAVRPLAETTDQSPRGRCRLTPSLPNAQPFAFAVFTFTIVLAVSRWLYVSPVSRREPPFSLNFLLLSQLPLFPLHAQPSPTQQCQSSHNIFTRISVSPCPNNILCPLRWEAKYPLSGAGTHMTQPRLRPPIVRLYAAFWPPNHTSPLAQAALSHPSIVCMTWSHIHLPQKSLYIFPPPCPHASSSKSAVLAPSISHRSHIASSLSNPQHV